MVQNRKSFCISAIISDQKNYQYLSYLTGIKEKTIFHFWHCFCTTSGIRKESICPAVTVASEWYKKENLFAFCTTHTLPNPHAESLLIPLLLRFCTGKRSGTKEKNIFHFRHRFRPAFSESWCPEKADSGCTNRSSTLVQNRNWFSISAYIYFLFSANGTFGTLADGSCGSRQKLSLSVRLLVLSAVLISTFLFLYRTFTFSFLSLSVLSIFLYLIYLLLSNILLLLSIIYLLFDTVCLMLMLSISYWYCLSVITVVCLILIIIFISWCYFISTVTAWCLTVLIDTK